MFTDDLNANDFEITTYTEREKNREIDFLLASGEITAEEAERRKNLHKKFKHDSALRKAAEEGAEGDPIRVAAIESEIDQEFADLHRHDEILVTGAAKVIFNQIGFIAHPGMTWDELDLDQQDLYRRAGDETITFHYEAKETGLDEEFEGVEDFEDWD